ncbi:hypothetical protein BVRB_5g101740 [Beta vulgaris subsp. vulgaris]|nr:hypothetical protein BVRB_5g101740 [Beta vulgaris subsp. vulgaris]
MLVVLALRSFTGANGVPKYTYKQDCFFEVGVVASLPTSYP